MITHLSFDLDGTLADETFDSLVWDQEIPKLYAEKHNVSLEEAKTRVYAEYYKSLYLEKIENWTDIQYWFKRLGLRNMQSLLNEMKKTIFVYDDVPEVLNSLKKKYTLIIITSASKHFLDLKLEAEGLKKYFAHTFSAPDDFHISRKNKEVFAQVIAKLKIQPSQLVHIGDDHYMDFEVPSSLGIRSFHLIRSGKMKHESSISSLKELKNYL